MPFVFESLVARAPAKKKALKIGVIEVVDSDDDGALKPRRVMLIENHCTKLY